MMSHQQISTNLPQEEQSLVRWLEHAIRHFREAAQVPQNLISDPTVERTCQAIDDDILVRSAEDLGVASDPALHELARLVPDLDVALASVEAQNAMREWVAKHQPLLILRALAKAVAKLTAQIAEGTIQDPRRIVRVFLVLTLASFSPSGAELLSEFGVVFNSRKPHIMIKRLGAIACKGDQETIDRMEHVILSNSRWQDWASWFIEQAQSLAPQCWDRLVISRQPADPTLWNALWDSLLNQKEGVDGN